MTCPVVMQVFFAPTAKAAHERDEAFPCNWWGKPPPAFLYGESLWQAPDGKGPVFRWSIDYVVAGDERWTIFGPYESRAQARSALSRIEERAGDRIIGYRLINQHCVPYVVPAVRGADLPRQAWTDG